MTGPLALQVVGFFDAPEVLDASVTPIPGRLEAPLQVVASSLRDSAAISVKEGLGGFIIGLYLGPPGEERLLTLVGGPGDNFQHVFIPQGSRISLRSTSTAPVNAGEFCILFLA